MSPEAAAALIVKNNFLETEVRRLADLVADLQEQLSWLKRQVFGQKTERFTPGDDGQQALDLGIVASSLSATTEVITYKRTKPARPAPHGREEIPSHLPRHEVVIMPAEDVSGMQRIGEKVTEQLEYAPPKYSVTKYVRPEFAGEINGTVVCGTLPPLCSEKGKYGASLISHVIVSKFEDHSVSQRRACRNAETKK